MSEWDQSDRFVSNNGRGPLTARILCIADGTAEMERWPIKGGRRVRFSLPENYLRSESCGWKLREPPRE